MRLVLRYALRLVFLLAMYPISQEEISPHISLQVKVFTHTTFGETHVQHIQYTNASIYKRVNIFLRSGSLEENLDMINVGCQSDRMSW